MAALTKYDWLNDPTGATEAGTTTSTAPTGLATTGKLPTAPIKYPASTNTTTEWLNWVSSRVVNSTAVGAERQMTMVADREPLPLIYGEDRVGAMVLNAVPVVLDGVDCVLFQCVWGYQCDSIVGSPTYNDEALPIVSDALQTVHFFYNGYGADSVPTQFSQAFQAASGIPYTDTLEGWCVSYIYIPVNKFNGVAKFEAVLKGRRVYDPRQDVASNLLTYSEEFNQNSVWSPQALLEFGSGSVVNDAVASPDGWQTAEKIVENTATSIHGIQRTNQLSVISGVRYTISVYVRSAGRTRCWLSFGNTGFVGYPGGTFNLTAVTATPSGTGTVATIEHVGSNWYRISVSATASATVSDEDFIFQFRDDAGNQTYTGNGTSGFHIWGAQFKVGSTPGTYNKTGATLGTQVLATPTTWTWSDNPSLCDANFLADFCRKTVNFDSVIAAANANDQQIASEKRRTLNVTFRGRENAKAVSETLRAYSATFHVPDANGIKLVPDRPGSPVATYRHADGQIVSVKVSKKDIGNLPTESEVVYTNRTITPWKDDSVFVRVEGAGSTLPLRLTTVKMPGINRYSQARREAYERLNRMRTSDMTVTLDVFDIGIKHEQGDLIIANHPLWNLDKTFRVGDPEPIGNGMWRLPCAEYNQSGYSDDSTGGPTYPDTGFTNPLLPPATPTGLGYEFEQNGIDIYWNRNPELTVTEYELRVGTDWSSGSSLHTTSTPTILAGTAFTWPPQAIGTYTIWIKARTSVGVESVTPASVTFTINAPTLSALSAVVEGANYKLEWTLGSNDLPIKFYRVKRAGVTIAEVNATEFVAPVDWTGTGAVTFTVQAVSICGCPGVESSANLSIQMPSQVAAFTGTAVVNNVLFYWTPGAIAGTQLPIKHFVLKKGDVYGSAGTIGDKSGDATFTTFSESAGGQFKYWIEPHDTAGNVGTAVSLLVQVSAPANFRIVDEFDGSSFDGTKTNAVIWDGSLYAPVNATETFQQHFQTNNGPWSSPQDQITAGYEIYIEPAQATSSYQKVFALGASVSGTMVSLILSGEWIDGADGTVTPTIEISNTSSTGPWTSLGNVWQAYASGFQWVRITLTFASVNANDIYRADALSLTLALQIETDSGWIDADDATGIWSGSGTVPSPYKATVPFNKNFIDVDSITVTPMGTAAPGSAITPMVVFNDVADPDNFDVYFFNSSGSTVKTDFSWNATGVL